MSDFDNLLYSDDGSNDAIDHIPKTPGPVTVHERESEDERDESDKGQDSDHDNESDSDKSDEEVNTSGKVGSDNDSEVERSDVENDAHDSDDSDDDQASAKEEVTHNQNEDSNNESKSGNEEEEMEVQSNKSSTPKRKVSDDSDDSSDAVQAKRLKVDSDEEASNEKNETSTKAIFGDLSSEDEEHEQKETVKDESNDSHSEAANEDDSMRNEELKASNEMDNEVFYEEDQQEPQIEETRIDVEIPRIVASLGQELNFVKLPNFLSVDTHPYDPSWYDEEGLDDEEGGYDDEGRARVKLKVENTMRWRNVVDNEGNVKKESNSRIVRWSDGSMSLHLGSEIFDIYKQQLMPGDNNHLFIRQGTGLQGQAVFRTKLTFRPHSTDSFTHRKMTLSLADRSQKTQKIRVLPTVGKDPEAHRSEMIKKEEDRLKASIRRENKMRRIRDRANVRGPTASYLEPDQYEEEDDEGAISLSAIKNKYKKGGPAYNVYTDSEGSEDDSDLDIKKKNEKKPGKIVESDED
ncbi:RNA polymerase-associated protein LEO1-like protein [Leptotrombidium deliense]|uniref:RNA polymerase-associated protein LEO1-like protein n=1 Tax=Leptotrombidium deliense TaxID=299467 RepID=A0A443SVQ1_9ACAR|nr:RNA polymerase-associated protein LEO1-like protein [Leptotrombidium deliense]